VVSVAEPPEASPWRRLMCPQCGVHTWRRGDDTQDPRCLGCRWSGGVEDERTDTDLALDVLRAGGA
jgi:hypothetical protein